MLNQQDFLHLFLCNTPPIVVHLTPGIIILKKNVSALTTHMRMLSHKFQPPGQIVLENIFKDFYYLSLCKNSTLPLFWPHPTPGNIDLK